MQGSHLREGWEKRPCHKSSRCCGIMLPVRESIGCQSFAWFPWAWLSQLLEIMSKDKQRAFDRIDREILAADALERARLLPPGPQRNEALKLAGLLRSTAESEGPVFAKRGRPRK